MRKLSLVLAVLVSAATLVAQDKRVTASNGWVKTPAAGETETQAFVSIENPGMYEVNEEVVTRRRAIGDTAWNWNAGISAPKLPAPDARAK